MTHPEPNRTPAGVLTALSLPTLMSSLGTSIANVALPSMAQALGASFHGVQWVVLTYLLVITALVVVAGRLGDKLGHRLLLLAGIALFSMASMLCGMASTLTHLLVARALQGVGAAVMMALTHAFVSEAVPPSHTGRAMGLLGSMSAVGTAVGPSLGGLLISAFGWPAIFWLNIPLGIAALALAHRFLPVPRTARGVSDRSPVLDFSMLRDRLLRSSLVMNALVSMVMMTTLVVGPFYLSRSLALPTTSVGLAMSVGPIVTALIGIPSGRLADRVGAGRMSLIGLIGITLGATLLSLMPASFGLPGYLGPIALLTASYGVFQTANNTVVMSSANATMRGVTSGMLGLSRNLGLIAGTSIMGAAFAITSRAPDIARGSAMAIRTGMRSTYALAALVIVAALALGSRDDLFTAVVHEPSHPPTGT